MKKIVFAVLVFTIFILAGCNGNQVKDAAKLDAVPFEFVGKTNPLGVEAASAGADIFKSSCQTCHGPEGHGDGPASGALNPAPKNLAELQKTVADDYLFWRISTGKDGTSMISWEGILTEEQIWQLVAFIRTLE